MSRIVVVSAGFWGNVMPFVPVGNELVKRGHEVVFAVPDGLHPPLAGEPFTLAPAGTPFAPDTLSERHDALPRAGARAGARRAGRLWIRELLVEQLDPVHRALLAATEGADLVLTHPIIGFCARMAAEVRGLPWMTGHVFPMMVPRARHAPSRDPFRRTGRAVDERRAQRAWRRAAQVSGVFFFDRRINAFRGRIGLDPVQGNVLLGGLSPTDVLVLSSPRYHPVPDDWPPHVRTTGFTVWPGPSGATVPPELDDHLAAGDPPVLVTLGTAAAADPGPLLEAIVPAVDAVDTRAVFLVGERAVGHPALRGRRDVWPFAPLPPVLARCRAVVHAGGFGTTAAVLAAGLPSVVVPAIVDQVWHARRLAELGVGVAVEDAARRPAPVAAALRQVLEDPEPAAAARRLAGDLAAEDGPGTAADAIESRLAAAPTTP